MRVAFVSPLPPEPTGIGDYSFELLEELRHLVDVTAVVRDDLVGVDRAPEGVDVIGLIDLQAKDYDIAVYQMGNNPKYHRYLFGRALDEPGLLVLHDPSLADFYAELCGGAESMIFRDEVEYDRPDIPPEAALPLIDAGEGRRDLDRLEVLLARRLVTSNIRTLVHSHYVAGLMQQRYGGADVQAIQLPAQAAREVRASTIQADRDGLIFGVFGGINYYKRIEAVVTAFLELHQEYPTARLVIAGRPDDRLLTAKLHRTAARPELGGSIEVLTDLSLDELEAQMSRCDVAISLRWPTAGEMSATLIRTFGAGRPAIVSDVVQFRELDESFCWRISTDPDLESSGLVALLRQLCENPAVVSVAGDKARDFVERQANYRVVAERYVEHLEECAPQRRRARRRHAPYSLLAQHVFGVNVVASSDPRSMAASIADSWARLLVSAGIDAPVHLIEGLEDLPVVALESKQVEEAPSVGTSGAVRELWTQQRDIDKYLAHIAASAGSHPIDLLIADSWNLLAMTAFAEERNRRGRKLIVMPDPFAIQLDPGFRDLLEMADEVWCSTPSTADACLLIAQVPVRVVSSASPAADRRSPHGTRPQRVCTVIDGRASFLWANPMGVIEAWQAAFEPDERGRSVELSVISLELGMDERFERLRAQLDRTGGRLIVANDQADLVHELTDNDVYVSMRRSAGYDFWAAHALANGLAVIEPAICSGAAMNSDIRLLVGHDVLDISKRGIFLDALPRDVPRKDRYLFDPRASEVAGALRHLALRGPDESDRDAVGARRAAQKQFLSTIDSARRAIEALTWASRRVSLIDGELSRNFRLG